MSSFVSGFTFNELPAVDASKMILAKVFNDASSLQNLTIMQEIVAKEQIPFLGLMGAIGIADPGCSPSRDAEALPGTEKFWDPKKIFAGVEMCASNYEAEITAWMMQKGVKRQDLDQTIIMEWVAERFGGAWLEGLLRHIWFGATDAANYSDSPAGYITDSFAVTKVNVIDGLWKQLFAIGTGTPARKYSITKNSGNSYANQALGAGEAYTILGKLYTSADIRLRNAPNKVIYVTRTIADNYMEYLESKNGGVPQAFEMTINGQDMFKFRGVPVIVEDFWDRMISTIHDSGTTHYLPHRAIMTTKDQLVVGVDSIESFKSFDAFYDRMTKKNVIDAYQMLDAKVMEDYMVQLAY